MARALLPVKIIPTVATWNAIWNLTAINEEKEVFKIVTMQTYAKTYEEFQAALNSTLKSVDKSRLGVGVETWPFLDEDIEKRIEVSFVM